MSSSSSDEGDDRALPFGPNSTQSRAANPAQAKRVFIFVRSRPHCSIRGREWDALDRDGRSEDSVFWSKSNGRRHQIKVIIMQTKIYMQTFCFKCPNAVQWPDQLPSKEMQVNIISIAK